MYLLPNIQNSPMLGPQLLRIQAGICLVRRYDKYLTQIGDEVTEAIRETQSELKLGGGRQHSTTGVR